MKTKLTTSLIAASLAAGASLHGQIYYEDFDYAAGNLSTVSSGTWSGGSVDSPGLTYGDLDSGGNTALVDGNNAFSSVDFSGFLGDGDTLWFSVVTDFGTIGTNQDFAFAFGTDAVNGTNNVPMSNSGSGFGFRVKGNQGGLNAAYYSAGAITNLDPVSISVDDVQLIVGEIIFGSGGADTINLYLAGTDLSLGSVVSTASADLSQGAFDTISFAAKGATSGDRVDEIRFGVTSNDVLIAVPEPSSFALLAGMFGMTWVMLRRRS